MTFPMAGSIIPFRRRRFYSGLFQTQQRLLN